MNIGLDATALPDRPVGAGRYITHLIRSLAESSSNDEFFVFVHRSRQPMLGELPKDRFHLIPLLDKPIPLRLIWEQTVLPHLARRLGLHLLHSPHYTMPLLKRFVSVVTLHDMTIYLYPRMHTYARRVFYRYFIQVTARKAQALIADSESTRQDAIRLLNIPSRKITTVPLGVDEAYKPVSEAPRLEQVRKMYNLPEKFILFVGLLEPRKNLPALLRAFSRIAPRLGEYHLVIAGRQGWMSAEFYSQLDSLGIRGKTLLTGYIPEEDLPAVYSLARLFVYPSLYEGFGLPVLEAMACGTPIITSNVSAMPETVGDAGVLVAPRDDHALAEAILDLLTDEVERNRLAEAGLERAGLFTWKRTAEKTLQVYQQALGVS